MLNDVMEYYTHAHVRADKHARTQTSLRPCYVTYIHTHVPNYMEDTIRHKNKKGCTPNQEGASHI